MAMKEADRKVLEGAVKSAVEGMENLNLSLIPDSVEINAHRDETGDEFLDILFELEKTDTKLPRTIMLDLINAVYDAFAEIDERRPLAVRPHLAEGQSLTLSRSYGQA